MKGLYLKKRFWKKDPERFPRVTEFSRTMGSVSTLGKKDSGDANLELQFGPGGFKCDTAPGLGSRESWLLPYYADRLNSLLSQSFTAD